METEIITLYVICDEFLNYMNRQDHQQSEMNDAEVLTIALVAMLYCSGNYAQARRWLRTPQYIPWMLSKSQFSRRFKRLQPVFVPLFQQVAEQFKSLNRLLKPRPVWLNVCYPSIFTLPILLVLIEGYSVYVGS